MNELLSFITLVSDRLRVETQNGFEGGGLPNATKANQTERFGSGLESIVVALCTRKRV